MTRLFTMTLATALLASAPAVLAADNWIGCYARNYDAAHLERNPGQKVRTLAVRLEATEEPAAAYTAILTANTATGRLTYRHNADCLRAQAALECWVTPYRGYVVLTRTPDGLRLENPLGFRLEAGDALLEVEADPDHRVFLLSKAKAEACR